MVGLVDLWLPILLSAVFVFVVSSIVHMALPIHKGDWKKLKNEDAVMDFLRGQGLVTGGYMFPCAGSMKECGTPEFMAKLKRGPAGHMTILPPGGVNMGKSLIQWFLFCLVIGVVVAYIASITLGPAAPAKQVFRLTATAALLAYGLTNVTDSIWKGVSWTITVKFLFDGLLYALATGAAFMWFWPKAG